MVDLSNKSQVLLDANPIHKKIPAIVHNGKPVAESLVILEYLEEAFPEHVPLMPKDVYERAQVRFWAEYIYKVFTTIQDTFTMKPGTPEKQAACEAIMEFVKTFESATKSFSAEGPFFTGDKFRILDITFGPFCNALVILERFAGVVVPGPTSGLRPSGRLLLLHSTWRRNCGHAQGTIPVS